MCCRTTFNNKQFIACVKRSRRVSFTTDHDEIFEVERVEAALIQDLFYGAADYQRFREERRSSSLCCEAEAIAMTPTSPLRVINTTTKPKKHGEDVGYLERRQRLQRLVATRDAKITTSTTATTKASPRRPSSSLRRAPRRGPSQQITLQNMRSRVAAASA